MGFETRRLPDTNKLAYFYAGQISKDGDVHPLMQLAYDELKMTLAKLKQGQSTTFTVSETSTDEQPRVECAFCQRKFVTDRIETHQFICMKISTKPKRKVWDEKKKRLEGTVFEKYQDKKKDGFHDRFQLCLSRRDQANMEKIIRGLKLSREDYI